MFRPEATPQLKAPAFVALRDRTIATVVSASSLGLLWAWYMYAGCGVSTEAFGAKLDDAVAHQTFSMMWVLLNLIATRFWKTKDFPAKAYALFGFVLAAVSTLAALVFIESGNFSSPAQAVIGVLSGLAYSSILIAWIACNLNHDLKMLLSSAFLATAILGASYLVLTQLSHFASLISLLYPLVSMALLVQQNVSKKSFSSSRNQGLHLDRRRMRLLLYSLSLVLCGGFSRGILSTSWILSQSLDWAWGLGPLSVIAFAVVLFLPGKNMGNTVLASLAGAVCIVVMGALFLPPDNVVLSSLIFAIAWLLIAFAIASAIDCFREQTSNPIGAACTCIAFVLFASALSKEITSRFPAYNMELLVFSMVLMILSLAITIATQSHRPTAVFPAEGSRSSIDTGDRCRALADHYDLTEREYDVLLLLAKGNTLKGVAEKLLVSESTAKSHRSHIYQKLGIKSRQSLINMLENDEV